MMKQFALVSALSFAFGLAMHLPAIASDDAAHRGKTVSLYCHVLTHDAAPGDIIGPTNTKSAGCETELASARLSYDRKNGRILAGEALAAGTNLGRLWFADTGAEAGEDLVLIARSGPVSVRRPVTALQSARPGHRLFVRDQNGSVYSIRFVPEAEK